MAYVEVGQSPKYSRVNSLPPSSSVIQLGNHKNDHSGGQPVCTPVLVVVEPSAAGRYPPCSVRRQGSVVQPTGHSLNRSSTLTCHAFRSGNIPLPPSDTVYNGVLTMIFSWVSPNVLASTNWAKINDEAGRTRCWEHTRLTRCPLLSSWDSRW